ncbi:hypothetical protein ACTFIU_007237 [Dictyostelium citrinum]
MKESKWYNSNNNTGSSSETNQSSQDNKWLNSMVKMVHYQLVICYQYRSILCLINFINTTTKLNNQQHNNNNLALSSNELSLSSSSSKSESNLIKIGLTIRIINFNIHKSITSSLP